MTSRTPPSRRDPGPNGLHSLMRVAKATTQQIPGLGRVPFASSVVPQRLEAKLRGKASGGSAGGVAIDTRYVYMNHNVLGTFALDVTSDAVAVGSLFGQMATATLALVANDEINISAFGAAAGTLYNVSLTLTKIGDATGVPTGSTPTGTRQVSGSGMTSIVFPSMTTTATFQDSPTYPDTGIQVLATGWYYAQAVAKWDS